MSPSGMTAAVTWVSFFLARSHGVLLRGCDQGVNLLPFLPMDLLDLLPLLR
jgi:hypothetical protein